MGVRTSLVTRKDEGMMAHHAREAETHEREQSRLRINVRWRVEHISMQLRVDDVSPRAVATDGCRINPSDAGGVSSAESDTVEFQSR